MKNRLMFFATSLSLIFASCGGTSQTSTEDVTFGETYEFNPRKYICYRAPEKMVIDGKMSAEEWDAAPWTDYFVDIEGSRRPLDPRFKTRAKIMWDDEYVYFAAYLEEPDVWAKLTERESVIYFDNDFEIFLDPDGDTHKYMEYEVNAFSTEWDLMLLKPYRDWGYGVLNTWNINGVKSAVHVDGTINNGNDTDKGWSVEIAMPIASLTEIGVGSKIENGTQWRAGFSRVEWYTEWKDGTYNVIANKDTGRSGVGGEDNWVWSAQGAIAMHQPETWGFIQFSTKTAGSGEDVFVWNKNEDVKWALRKLYYRMGEYKGAKGVYPTALQQIKPEEITVDGLTFNPTLTAMESDWEIAVDGFDGKRVHIVSDGRTWISGK